MKQHTSHIFMAFLKWGQSGQLEAIHILESDAHLVTITYQVRRRHDHAVIMHLKSNLDEWRPTGYPGKLDDGHDGRNATAYYVNHYDSDSIGRRMDLEHKKGNVDLTMDSKNQYDVCVLVDVSNLRTHAPDLARVILASHF